MKAESGEEIFKSEEGEELALKGEELAMEEEERAKEEDEQANEEEEEANKGEKKVQEEEQDKFTRSFRMRCEQKRLTISLFMA